MSSSALRIVSLLPDLLGTYGDSGNIEVLAWRLTARGLPLEIIDVRHGRAVPVDGDLYLLGGGEDDAQAAATQALRGPTLQKVVDRGTPVFAVCAGLQLLGRSFAAADGRAVPGLDLLDLSTTRLARRAVGETLVTPDPLLELPVVTGFSNHGGLTVLGPSARPFGSVTYGPGNAGAGDPTEGVLQGSVIGTYLHGPVLARNPALADYLLTLATGHALDALPAGPPERLHAERVGAPRTPSARPLNRLTSTRSRPVKR